MLVVAFLKIRYTRQIDEVDAALPTDLESNSRLRNELLCDSSPAPAGAPKAASQAAVPSAPGGNLRTDWYACGSPAGNVLLENVDRKSAAALKVEQLKALYFLQDVFCVSIVP